MRLTSPSGSRPRSSARTSARTPTTEPGFTNPNRQTVERTTGSPSTTRTGQVIYALRCAHCRHLYGCNGLDIKERRCPACQNGTAGEPLPIEQPHLFG